MTRYRGQTATHPIAPHSCKPVTTTVFNMQPPGSRAEGNDCERHTSPYGSLHADSSASLGQSRHPRFSSNQPPAAPTSTEHRSNAYPVSGIRKFIDLELFHIVGTLPAITRLPRSCIVKHRQCVGRWFDAGKSSSCQGLQRSPRKHDTQVYVSAHPLWNVVVIKSTS